MSKKNFALIIGRKAKIKDSRNKESFYIFNYIAHTKKFGLLKCDLSLREFEDIPPLLYLSRNEFRLVKIK